MSTKTKIYTGSGTFDVRSEMLKDTSDMLENVEITDIAQQCVLLKKKEDEVAELEDKLKAKKEAQRKHQEFLEQLQIGAGITIVGLIALGFLLFAI